MPLTPKNRKEQWLEGLVEGETTLTPKNRREEWMKEIIDAKGSATDQPETIGTVNLATYGYFGIAVATSATSASGFIVMEPRKSDYEMTTNGSFRLNSDTNATITNMTLTGTRMPNLACVVITSSNLTPGKAYLIQANNDRTASVTFSKR